MFSNANCKHAPSVAVLASEITDQRRMLELLAALGYRVVPFPDKKSQAEAGVGPDAIIVCHRYKHEPYPQLPETSVHQRVVVVSDCSSENTVVKTLEAGAHHFSSIDDPCTIISARLKAALRQHCEQTRAVLNVAPFKFNLERRTVYLDDKLINLCPKEFEFAYYLFSNRHRIVVLKELMRSVWSLPSDMDPRRIDTAACRVRKKMQLNADTTGWCLKRLRRVGYELRRFSEPNYAHINTAKEVASSNTVPRIVRRIKTA